MQEIKYKIRPMNTAIGWLLKVLLSVEYSLMSTGFVVSSPESGFYFFFMLAVLIVVSEKKIDLTVINNDERNEGWHVEDGENEGS